MPDRLRRAIERRLDGDRRVSIPLDLRDRAPFETAVWQKALEIPRGEVRPYGWIASEIGRPKAVRAVGSALGRNPIPLIVPCHRVVRTDGTIGQYSLGGPAVKRRVLEAEGVDLGRAGELRLGRGPAARLGHDPDLLPSDLHACAAHHAAAPGHVPLGDRGRGGGLSRLPRLPAGQPRSLTGDGLRSTRAPRGHAPGSAPGPIWPTGLGQADRLDCLHLGPADYAKRDPDPVSRPGERDDAGAIRSARSGPGSSSCTSSGDRPISASRSRSRRSRRSSWQPSGSSLPGRSSSARWRSSAVAASSGPTRIQIRDSAIVGGLLLGGGMGLVSFGEQSVPSGLTAIFVAMMPLWVAVLGRLFFGQRLAPLAAVGVIVGPRRDRRPGVAGRCVARRRRPGPSRRRLPVPGLLGDRRAVRRPPGTAAGSAARRDGPPDALRERRPVRGGGADR